MILYRSSHEIYHKRLIRDTFKEKENLRRKEMTVPERIMNPVRSLIQILSVQINDNFNASWCLGVKFNYNKLIQWWKEWEIVQENKSKNKICIDFARSINQWNGLSADNNRTAKPSLIYEVLYTWRGNE